MFMDPATDVVLPFNWCACSVLLYLCGLVLAACAVCAIEEGRSLYWTPADKWLTGVIGVDHNDPLKPSHRLTNGPEPSKTIESDGSNIKKPS